MISYRVVIRNGSDAHNDSDRPLTKLELLKVGVATLLGLVIAIAFVLAASVIGLLLAISLVLVGLGWLIALALGGRVRLVRRRTDTVANRHVPHDSDWGRGHR